ncbi:hypothetical protein HRbin19_00588 [bacterium HR19]|nr:hypothetical protein HRbin19_00588 [bacterium HR19]
MVIEFFVKLVISLAVMTSFLVGLIWFMKKRGLLLIPFQNIDHQKMQITSFLKLTPKAYLFTVKIEDKELVVGVTDKNINLVYEINQKQ